MNTPSEVKKDLLGVAEHLRPSEPITLGPGASAWQLVLKKIKELSISVRREGNSHLFHYWSLLLPVSCFRLGGHQTWLSQGLFWVSSAVLVALLP